MQFARQGTEAGLKELIVQLDWLRFRQSGRGLYISFETYESNDRTNSKPMQGGRQWIYERVIIS